jgi:abhydrolase domain-containing protein 12
MNTMDRDASVAALPPCLPGGVVPMQLRLIRNGCEVLTFIFTANWAAVAAISVWDMAAMPNLLLCLFAVQLLLYAIAAALSASTTLQGWITFGHPAKRLGAANDAGPFDRGATTVGIRDYSIPAHAGLPHARQVWVPTSDGERLGAWHILPAAQSRRVAMQLAAGMAGDAAFDGALNATAQQQSGDADEPWAALYLHGNFESRAKWVSTKHAELLSYHFGLHVLLLDYRGFGDSSGGPPSVETLPLDAMGAVRWFEARGVPPSRLLIYGHSLGSGVAAQLGLQLGSPAAGSPAAGSSTPPWALVLEGSFYSLRAAALTFPAALPLLALPGVPRLLLRCYLDGLRTADALTQIPHVPVLLLHGATDSTVPIQHAVALERDVGRCRPAGAAPFRLVPLAGCDHLHAALEPSIIAHLGDFFDAVVAHHDALSTTVVLRPDPPAMALAIPRDRRRLGRSPRTAR